MSRQQKYPSTAIVLLLGTLLAAPAALAGPPVHAPANGWRAQQYQPYYAGHRDDRQYYGYRSARGNCNGDDVGTVLGAVAGGVIGSNVARGDDRAIGTIVGAVLGGVIGHQIGRAGDSDCNGRPVPLGRAGVPVQGYYPRGSYQQGYYPQQVYYPPPRPIYVVPNRRPAYVVTVPRRTYAAPHRQPDHRADRRHDDHRGNQDHRRDDRTRGDGDKRGSDRR
jgi:hypothetical protein